MKLEHFLTLYTNIKSKWIKDLNLRLEIIKLLEKTQAITLPDVSRRIFFGFISSSKGEKKKQTKINKT